MRPIQDANIGKRQEAKDRKYIPVENLPEIIDRLENG